MKSKSTLDGHDLKEMFTAGANWLEKIVPDINALNVYPVPDGDCGNNMLSTMRASLEEATKVEDGNAAAVVQAIARGALMGARGNSGVILSQIWHGFARETRGRETIDAKNLAQAFQGAADTAYLALSNPVEGTILTVIRDAASAAQKDTLNASSSPVSVLTAAVTSARAAVINTPNLLPVLKEAGGVDAGGHGLFTLLEGALLYIKGETDGRSPDVLSHQRPLIARDTDLTTDDEERYGFCTQFMVKGENLSVDKLRQALDGHGKSVIVVGDAAKIRVHIHTCEPEAITEIASEFGSIFDIDIRNMDEQYQDFLLMKQSKASMLTAVIAVANGDGMINTFTDFGVAAIVPGGQSMNPSTMDILSTVEKVNSNNIIILPNNKNVIPTALLVQSLTAKKVRVIPTKTVPQGIAALMEFVPEADFEINVKQMAANISTVKTIEITRAVRSAKLNDLNIQPGQFIGLLDTKLLAAGNTPDEVISQLLRTIDLTQSQIVTLYFGTEADQAAAEPIYHQISELFPHLEVGIVNGGQPHYHYIISVE